MIDRVVARGRMREELGSILRLLMGKPPMVRGDLPAPEVATADEPTADEPTADGPTADGPTADGPTAEGKKKKKKMAKGGDG